MNKQTFWATCCAVVLGLLTACGGGGGSDSAAGPSPPVGATSTVVSTGAITGFGSIHVNGVRFDTSGASVVVDDRPGGLDDLAVGHVVRVEGEIDDAGNARALRIESDHLLHGEVQGVDAAAGTITVLGQIVMIDDDTSIDDSIPGGTLTGVSVGLRIEVHGFIAADGRIRATRIELAGADDTGVELTGRITALDTAAQRFAIGDLDVDFSSAQLEDFDGRTPAVGDLVEAKGTSFADDGALLATEVELKNLGVGGRDGDDAELEGLVTRFASPQDFDVAGQPVRTNGTTQWIDGDPSHLGLDVKVEVEGRIDDGGVMVADEVKFKRSGSVRLAARVEDVDADANSFQALGLTILVTDLTRLEDKQAEDDTPFAVADLRTGDWVELRGHPHPSGDGRIVATRLERDDPEDEVELRGRASDLAAPAFRVTGVAVETTSGTEFEREDQTMNASAFFAEADGRIVEVDGRWDGSTLTADEAEIEDQDD